jgi:hypothetical protein
VASYLTEAFNKQDNSPFDGVVFHGLSGWQVMGCAGHVDLESTSPIRAHQAFVVFDEARCRCVPLFLMHLCSAHVQCAVPAKLAALCGMLACAAA